MSGSRREALRQVSSIVTFVAVALFARAALADHYVVPTGSMEPTVEVGDRIFVHKAAYGLRLPLSERWMVRYDQPARGDVVVLSSPEDGKVLLKRVAAIHGDIVEVRGGRLLIGGSAVTDPANLADGGGPDFGPRVVPPGKLLVLGDHRGASHDGRGFGWVSQDAVFGRAVAVFRRDGELVWEPL